MAKRIALPAAAVIKADNDFGEYTADDEPYVPWVDPQELVMMWVVTCDDGTYGPFATEESARECRNKMQRVIWADVLAVQPVSSAPVAPERKQRGRR